MTESLKETITEFSQNHYVLYLGLRILISIMVIVIIINVLGYVCSLLYKMFDTIVTSFDKINSLLDKVCTPCNKSSNPWGMVIALLFASMFYFAPNIVKGDLKEFWAKETIAGIPMHEMWGIVITAITGLTGISTAKSRFPLVLLVKTLRIPLDIISLPLRLACWITMIPAGLTGNLDKNDDSTNDIPPFNTGGNPGTVLRKPPVTGPAFFQNTANNSPEEEPVSVERYDPDPTPSDFSDGFSYFGDQHTDQYRNSEDGGSDGYNYGRTESGQTVYYSGDYRPYSGTGENVEYYHLDEGYTPMDSD